MKTVYLCGAINGRTDSECKDWRELAKARLDVGFNCLDPMRRDYRGAEDQSVETIVSGDIKDIDDSDIVLAVADAPSWGTAMEIFYANSISVYVVTVCGQSRISPWLSKHSSAIFPTLIAAIDHINGLSR